MRRLTHLLVLAAFVFSCGGQWYVLQGVAWIKMIHDFSQEVPLAQAVAMTLSGEYPCDICKAIEQKKQAEKNEICAIEKYDKAALLSDAVASTQPDFVPATYPIHPSAFLVHAEPPPVPPPRLVSS